MDCLPPVYDNHTYIRSCLNLLDSWSWLYKFRNISLLESGILDFSELSYLRFLNELELNEFKLVPQGFIKEDWPLDLKTFVTDCHKLKLNIPRFEMLSTKIDDKLFMGMKLKKREEVTKMSYLVSETCKKYGIKRVVDLGCGVGHIDRILSHNYGLKVLGIEKDADRVRRAKELDLDGCIKYITEQLTEETLPEVISLINSWLKGENVCIIALHSCGDLSLIAGNLFHELPHAKCHIIIPCCYHRSSLLLNNFKKDKEVNTNLLRLASDTNAKRWELMTSEEHLSHARSVLSRNIIQLCHVKGGSCIKKNQRRLLRNAGSYDWNKCLENCLERVSGLNEVEMKALWHDHEWRFKQVESYSCLQVCLQGVIEGLIILDIVNTLLFKEKYQFNLLRVFNDITSPRSVAIIVNR